MTKRKNDYILFAATCKVSRNEFAFFLFSLKTMLCNDMFTKFHHHDLMTSRALIFNLPFVPESAQFETFTHVFAALWVPWISKLFVRIWTGELTLMAGSIWAINFHTNVKRVCLTWGFSGWFRFNCNEIRVSVLWGHEQWEKIEIVKRAELNLLAKKLWLFPSPQCWTQSTQNTLHRLSEHF